MFSPEQVLKYADSCLKYNDNPVKLDIWQELFLQDQSRFLVLLKGRQEGFSFAVAAKKFIELQSPDVVNHTVQFVSYNLADAIDKIRYVEIMAHSMPEKYRKKIKSETKTSIEFEDTNGTTTSRLLSIACRPPRGKPGDVVLDECAVYGTAKSQLIYTAALPSISRGGTITLGSTPLGMVGMFYDIYTNAEKRGYKSYTVPWWYSGALCKDVMQARQSGIQEMDTEDRVRLWGKEILQQALAALDVQSFQQEYECTFIDSAESYISLDLIYANTPGMREGDRAVALDEGQGEPVDGLEVYAFKTADDLLAGYPLHPALYGDRLFLGYDVARRRDASVIHVIGVMPNGKKRTVANIEMINKPFEYQRDQFRKIMKSLPVVRSCIDQGGIGEDTTETLQREFSSTKVEGLVFNNELKEILAMGAREGLEKREFLLPNDARFHRQIHSIKRMPTAGGNVRYDSERNAEGHADSFWAWALANYAVSIGAPRKNFYAQLREKREAEQKSIQSEIVDAGSRIERGKTLDQVLRERGLR
jgi:phage FluMu gp28-like protein